MAGSSARAGVIDARPTAVVACVVAALASCGGGAPAVAPTTAVVATAPPPVVEAPSPAPVVEEPLAEIKDPHLAAQVEVGDFHSCALLGDGTVRCWGRNKQGQLGDGTASDRAKPVKVNGLSGAVEIALGATFSCARVRNGSVRCWGSGRMLGDGKVQTRRPPTAVAGITDAVQLSASGYMVCARFVSGKARCWGSELAAQEGAGPVASNVAEVAAASAHACARLEGGSVECYGGPPWGGAAAGAAPFGKPNVARVEHVATGDGVACALVTGGAVACWGMNELGQLALPPDADAHATPVTIRDVARAVRISAGEASLCAVVADGSALCWGANEEGQLGRGTRTTSELPQPLVGMPSVAEVTLGSVHACGRTRDGAVYCWGANAAGQLGDGTTERRPSPTRVKL